MSEDDQLVDNFPNSPCAAVSYQQGGRYHRHHIFTHDSMKPQDCSVCIKMNDVEMYGLFCGFKNGGRVANFVMNRMCFEIFTEQPINKSMTPEQIADQLGKRFVNVNERYVSELNEILSEIYIIALPETPTDEEKIAELKDKVRAGCTALIVLRVGDDLYILNCGTSQAYVLTESSVVRLIAAVHDNENPDEIQRLRELGVNPQEVSAPTRAIGDGYRSTYLSEEEPAFKHAKSPPVICEPEVFQVKIQPGWRHLLLVSGGMVQNIRDCEVDDIPMEIFDLFYEQSTLNGTASTLVFNVERKHKDAYDRHVRDSPERHFSNHREEMTLIYAKLQDAPSIISTIDSSISSTVGSINIEPDTLSPYVDLSPERGAFVAKELEKYVSLPSSSSR